MELGMEFFRLFLLGACIGLILNVLWIIYYQIPRMMRKIVDLEDNYRNLQVSCVDTFQQLTDVLKDHQEILQGLNEKVKSIEESHARDS